MFFNAEQTNGAIGAVVPEKAPGPSNEPSQHLSPQQFGKKAPAPGEAAGAGAEAGAGEAAAGAGAAEGAASLTELLPLLAL